MSIVECETENSHTVGARYKICRTYFRVTGQPIVRFTAQKLPQNEWPSIFQKFKITII